MKIIVLWLVSLFFVQCKNTSQNYSKNIEPIVKADNDTIISPLLEKYKSNTYFLFLLNENKELQKEITRIYDKNTENIHYQEDFLEPNLVLSRFIIGDFSEYDFVIRNGGIIFKNEVSVSKSKRYFEYKDWDNDNKKDLISYDEQCEAGCLNYYKYMSIYDVEKDTILFRKQLPVKKRVCYDSITLITDYIYN
ncbi:hypothetical protein [Capnocytophaga stomatis]|uniref:hypothetical protein n=1 Tax=Capnocytophaga stomatis TaxID=1848904 RepID=UPI001ACE5272|nr:hypothetical protein [Capnocytophaga stomatis]GIM50962.1 hypothetical protein CAPN003_24140 [Capnocytophaga stomatis]